MKCKSLSLAAGIIACGASATSLAITALTDWQMLCNDSVIVTATVLGGIGSGGCMPHQIGCSPDGFVGLTLRVHRVLAVKKDAHAYQDGDFARVRTVLGGHGHPLTEAEVAELFGGKTYIFGLEAKPSDDGSFWGNMWDPQQQSWIEDTLRQHAHNYFCPKLL